MYRELALKDVKARGWILEYLKNQSKGMTGNLDTVITPFNGKYWDAEDLKSDFSGEVFLGGLESKKDVWVFFEQTGYWIDGMVRCAHLADDKQLYEKAKEKIYTPLLQKDSDGYIGPEVLKDEMIWSHTVYFRSWIAEYEATGNPEILEALKNHFLRVPLKDVYDKVNDMRIMSVRNIADIEIALWLYDKTNDKRFLEMSEESYKRFNKLYSKDRGVAPNSKMRALTIAGMLEDKKANDNHGVTYCEICKLAAILYMHTGNEKYKEAAIKAFDKAYRDNILIDGVLSSTEYLNGNSDSRASHETCVVSDFIWAVGYLYMITGDTKYSDWVENAVFNGGIGSVSDDFRSNQYFSCPNQVIADDKSNHNRFYRGLAWMSFAPKDPMGCCTGNVNRFMPNFICRSWMKDKNVLTPFVYAPTAIKAEFNGKKVRIAEITEYPFKNSIRFEISTEGKTEFTLKLRVPSWAVKSKLLINEKDAEKYLKENIYEITRDFSNGDVIEISFEDKIELVENAGGISVKKGALLYALPIEEKKVIEKEIRGMGNPDYPHFSLYAESAWNYALSKECLKEAKFNEGEIKDNPWKKSDNKMSITLNATEVENWDIERKSVVKRSLNARKRGKSVKCNCCLTPLVPKKGTFKKGKQKEIELVPYCTTRLRIAIFPIA